ncbi:MAG: adenylyl-sulfate kinase [Helicobacteraceae bacterium]|nr:adenylyl-sulfate kinase [Helicobacteraceae bacterium]
MQKGAVIWITGLAGSGKSELTNGLLKKLETTYSRVILLDGDEINGTLWVTGRSRDERLQGGLKISRLCAFLAKKDMIVLCATINLFSEVYKQNRELIENYFEVLVDVPLDELIKRDKNKMYSLCLAGKIKNVVGIDISYDKPNPHFIIDNKKQNELDLKVEKLYLEAIKFLQKIKH